MVVNILSGYYCLTTEMTNVFAISFSSTIEFV